MPPFSLLFSKPFIKFISFQCLIKLERPAQVAQIFNNLLSKVFKFYFSFIPSILRKILSLPINLLLIFTKMHLKNS